tara:strand:+ start:2732 stop:2902 length:171 start_codon:yes stop_codon:yes gene_type:complete
MKNTYNLREIERMKHKGKRMLKWRLTILRGHQPQRKKKVVAEEIEIMNNEQTILNK